MLWHRLEPLEDDGTPDVLALNKEIAQVLGFRRLVAMALAELETLGPATTPDRMIALRFIPQMLAQQAGTELGTRQRLGDHLRARGAGPMAVALNAAAIADLEHGIEAWNG